MKRSSRQTSGGFALITAIIFLVLLTLVALAAIRGSGLEVKSSANNTLRATAFESSESTRALVSTLIDPLCYAGGWPGSIGGEVSDAEFASPLPAGLTIANNNTATAGPDNWCVETEATFNPNPSTVDARYVRTLDRTQINGAASVQRLYIAGAVGAGQAQGAGYSPPGIAVASGGGNIYFHVQSRGNERADAPEASYNTSAVYRYVIRR